MHRLGTCAGHVGCGGEARRLPVVLVRRHSQTKWLVSGTAAGILLAHFRVLAVVWCFLGSVVNLAICKVRPGWECRSLRDTSGTQAEQRMLRCSSPLVDAGAQARHPAAAPLGRRQAGPRHALLARAECVRRAAAARRRTPASGEQRGLRALLHLSSFFLSLSGRRLGVPQHVRRHGADRAGRVWAAQRAGGAGHRGGRRLHGERSSKERKGRREQGTAAVAAP